MTALISCIATLFAFCITSIIGPILGALISLVGMCTLGLSAGLLPQRLRFLITHLLSFISLGLGYWLAMEACRRTLLHYHIEVPFLAIVTAMTIFQMGYALFIGIKTMLHAGYLWGLWLVIWHYMITNMVTAGYDRVWSILLLYAISGFVRIVRDINQPILNRPEYLYNQKISRFATVFLASPILWLNELWISIRYSKEDPSSL